MGSSWIWCVGVGGDVGLMCDRSRRKRMEMGSRREHRGGSGFSDISDRTIASQTINICNNNGLGSQISID